MKALQIIPESNSLYQRQIINLEVDGKAKRVVFEFRYLYKTEKWYVSLFDAQTGNPICTYIPLIASYEYFNDLFEPFSYKNIGWLVCFPIVDNPTSENPTQDNLSDFAILWGDKIE